MKCIILSLVLLSTSAFALVDYSETESYEPEVVASKPKRRKTKKRAPRPNVARASKKSGVPKFMSVKAGFESLEVDIPERDGKVNTMAVAAHIKTNYGLFIEGSYWQASSSDEGLSNSTGLQSGNPLVKVGFNWLQLGDMDTLLNVDLIGGLSFAGESDFASSRTDLIFGVQTSKKIDSLVLQFEGQIRNTGNPGNINELDLGSIRSFSAGVGLYVSDDIRFSVKATSYKISESSKADREARLTESVSFATITPKLYLEVHPGFNVEMGAVFRTNREQSEQDLVNAKLYDVPGAYGTSFNAGISIAI